MPSRLAPVPKPVAPDPRRLAALGSAFGVDILRPAWLSFGR